MGTSLRPDLPAGLRAAAFVVLAACSGPPVVEPANRCANPCCDGPAAGIDCAQNPNLSCMEDADVCTARTYGCVNGSYFVMGPSSVPTSCGADGSTDDVTLVFGGD